MALAIAGENTEERVHAHDMIILLKTPTNVMGIFSDIINETLRRSENHQLAREQSSLIPLQYGIDRYLRSSVRGMECKESTRVERKSLGKWFAVVSRVLRSSGSQRSRVQYPADKTGAGKEIQTRRIPDNTADYDNFWTFASRSVFGFQRVRGGETYRSRYHLGS
uniref:Uncharacterized protein n=1 Tax=Vespula pensylvanica TaxID=30213 RepID=A0A834KXZ3_VESPE|nr:hypothetical protein H0235_013025 [Vespula pensylvanica]